MSTETRLKPCPFCGGAAKEFERFNANVITCRRCGVKVRQSEMGEGDAAVRWNQRATPVAAQAQQPVSGADGLQAVGALVADERELVALAVKHHIRFPRNRDLVAFIDEARAALAQQDADTVDAERYRAWRDALITGKTAEDDFIRLVADSLPTSVGVSRRPTAAEWDAAIDAARKENSNA